MIGVIVLLIAWVLGFSFALYNLKQLQKTRPERVAARAAYKKIKNEQLMKFYGIKKINETKSN